MDEIRGWLSVSKGLHYLSGSDGWFQVVNVEGDTWRIPGDNDRRPARLRGQRLGPGVFEVQGVTMLGATRARRRPQFAVRPPEAVKKSGRAKLVVDNLLNARDFTPIMLPSLWCVSREYGEEELSVDHSKLKEDLVLLQSPEFPMYASQSMGIGSYWCWGRSYRFEAETEGRHLMEFEQLDIGFSMSELPEMLGLVEEVVRAVAASLGVALAPSPFPVRSPDDLTMPSSPATSIVEFQRSVPMSVRELLLQRITTLGAVVEVLSTDPLTLGILVTDENSAQQVWRTVDSARRILAAELPPLALQPWWKSPLPVTWENDVDAGQSEHKIRAITSARVQSEDRAEHADEAELYIGDLEVGHAGVFADHSTFLKNLAEAGIDPVRYEWLLPMLEDAPPGMVKIGIGWERLVTALLGGSPGEVQLFPRRGEGTLQQRLPI